MRSLPRDYGLSPEKNLFHDTKNEIGLRKRTTAPPRSTTTPARSPATFCAFSPRALAKFPATRRQGPS